MITIKEVQEHINSILKESEDQELTKQARNKLTKWFSRFNAAKMYLETKPSKESIEKQLKECQHLKEVLEDRFKYFSRPPNYNGNLKSLYERRNNYVGLIEKTALLKYLLKLN